MCEVQENCLQAAHIYIQLPTPCVLHSCHLLSYCVLADSVQHG